MKISFITYYHSRRLDNLLQTLRFLNINHSDIISNSELVLVCQDNHQIEVEGFAEVNQILMNTPEMNVPMLTNEGVKAAKHDKIIVLESDRILPKGYFREVLDELHEGVMITTKKMKKLLNPATDEEIISETFETYCDDRSVTCEFGIKNMWSGNTACMKSDFLRVGGIDSNYIGYGWADCDMTLTMEKAGIKSIYKDNYTELHLWHEGQTYGQTDQKELFINNCIYCCKKWNRAIPNFMIKEISNYRKGRFFI